VSRHDGQDTLLLSAEWSRPSELGQEPQLSLCAFWTVGPVHDVVGTDLALGPLSTDARLSPLDWIGHAVQLADQLNGVRSTEPEEEDRTRDHEVHQLIKVVATAMLSVKLHPERRQVPGLMLGNDAKATLYVDGLDAIAQLLGNPVGLYDNERILVLLGQQSPPAKNWQQHTTS
jgi:hypothetical protein